MFEGDFHFEGQTILVNGIRIDATCGPIRTEKLNEFEAVMVKRMKVIGPAAALPTEENQEVDIDGTDWTVESSTACPDDVAVVTFMRFVG